MTIDAIIVDFGGVLIDWNPKYLYRKLLGDETKVDWFLSNICTGAWNLEQDRGRTLAEGTRILVEKFPEQQELINAYYDQWEQMLGGAIDGTVAILNELKKRYKVYGLTNWSAETFPVAQARFDFLNTLDGIVVSGEERLIKPDPQIYQLLLNRYNLKAANCIFIDDNADNVKAAKELAFCTIHFTSPDKLKEQLLRLGAL